MKNLLFLILLFPLLLSAQLTATKIFIPKSDGNKIPAVQYMPKFDTSLRNLPIVIFLHGAGEVGDGTLTGLNKLYNSTNHANLLKYGNERGFIVLAPQFVQAYNGWRPDWNGAEYVNNVITWARSNLPIDPSRIYLTGLSSGGGGTWDFLIRKQEYTNLIAAAVPICPAPQDGDWSLIVKAGTPVWSFHANDDRANPVTATINPVNYLNSQKINPPAKTTIYPTGGHGIWGTVYGTSAMYDWLLAQKKGSVPAPEPPQPPAKTIVAKLEITLYSDGTTETKKLQ